MKSMDVAELARLIDHCLLTPEATPDQIDRLCDEAVEHRICSVFVNPVFVERAARRVEGSGTMVGSVAGFPLGAGSPATILDQARRVLEAGASEVDMVAWIGGLVAGEMGCVVDTIRAVAGVVHGGGTGRVLKVILETGALTDEQIALGCRCCREGEADFVKTSTGFHPTGGATVEHVRLLRRHGSPMKVKASGGIRDLDTALAMIDAGAERLGTSSTVSILRELHGRGEG